MTSNTTIAKRWRDRLTSRLALLRRARIHNDRVHNAASAALLAKRKEQVAFARRVIARHADAPLRLRALDHARHKLAQHVFETGGNNRGAAVEAIITYAGGDIGEPWCVDFDIWCYGHAGSKVVKPGWYRAVRYMNLGGTHSVAKNAAMAGDAVRYTFDHTGIFEHYANSAGNPVSVGRATHIVAIEGNTGPRGAVSDGNGSDGVYRKIRALTDVRDFIRVPN